MMALDFFGDYINEINKAYGRGDATEHTHRPALKKLIVDVSIVMSKIIKNRIAYY